MRTNYFQKQQELHSAAEKILEDLDLINFLKKYGTVQVVGSFALNLMSWEDIDVVIISEKEPKLKDYLETVDHLFAQDNVYSLSLQDFRKSIHPDRPQGIYCGVQYLIKADIFWKIDIWFFPNNNRAVENMEMTKSKLNDQNKQTILEIKNRMREEFPHGKEITGIDVYEAVLNNKVTTLEEFKNYIEKSGRKV